MFYKIFNRNTVKISYSCMPNLKQIIDGRNKSILQKTTAPPISMKTVRSMYFCFGATPANSTFATKTANKKGEYCHSSHWNYQQKLKRLKFFRNFKDGWRRQTIFTCKPPEVHFTIRNRVPYNKLLTNRAFSGRTGEYWRSAVFVRTSLHSVRTVTTSGQYSLVRPLRSVSKRSIFTSPSANNC